MSIYLDYNATAPMRPEALAVLVEYLAQPANASSVHSYGRRAKSALEQARAVIAQALSCWGGELVFTACGTESNALAFQCAINRPVLVAATDHPAVLQQRDDAILIPVDANGIVQQEALAALLTQYPQAFVSVMLVNNETGVIQPVREIAALVHEREGIIHCDAVQALGKIPVDVGMLGVDLLSIAAHKMGGACGAAALYVREKLILPPLLKGGGQELRRRAGTEPLAAICAFAKAVELATTDVWQSPLRNWLNGMEQELRAKGASILGADAVRAPNVSAVILPGKPAEIQLMKLDLQGLCISSGSACSSGRVSASHVARAMGYSVEQASCMLRISGGWATTQQDIQACTQLLARL